MKKDDLHAYNKHGKTMCLVITNNNLSGSQIIQVVYLYPEEINPKLPTHVPIMVKDTPMTARCEYIQSIDRSRFVRKFGKITDEEQNEINQGLLLSLGIGMDANMTRKYAKYELFKDPFRKEPDTMDFQQYQIYHIQDDPKTKPIGREMQSNRPAIIVSNDIINHNSNKAEIVYLTSQEKTQNIMSHVRVRSGRIMATALCEQIFTVDQSRIRFKVDDLGLDDRKAIRQGIRHRLSIKDRIDVSKRLSEWQKNL